MKNYSERQRKRYLYVFAAAFAVYVPLFVVGIYLLTQSLPVSLTVALFAAPFSAHSFAENAGEKRTIKTEKQFAEFMQLVLTSVCAGKSLEQATAEILEEADSERHHPFGLIRDGLSAVLKRTSMNYNFYDEFIAFAISTDSGDIISTAYAIKIVGLKGGNLPFILRNSLAGIRVKTETDTEIRQTLALPKYNHRIITCMPFAMVIMIKELSKEYIDVLYNTRAGMIVVICVSGAILLSWVLGNRLCKIDI